MLVAQSIYEISIVSYTEGNYRNPLGGGEHRGTKIRINFRYYNFVFQVVTGVIGRRMPRYCLFGNTVNLTSRTETTGIQVALHF